MAPLLARTPALPVILSALLLLLAACATATDEAREAGGDSGDNLVDRCVDDYEPGVDYFPDKVEFEYADGVSVRYEGHYKVVEVDRPDDPDAEPLRYVLSQCGTPEPDPGGELAEAQVIEVPATEVVSLTTTNLPHFALLDRVDDLAAVASPEFVSTPAVRRAVAAGDVESAGSGSEPDLESLFALEPDLLVLDAFGETVMQDVKRLVDGGVPTAVNADFDETTLLGRAEWLKYTALFLNAEREAAEAFSRIEDDYRRVAATAAEADERPSVLFNLPYQGTWYMPGGDSYLSAAVYDAGGEYVFGDDTSTGSLELDVETVLAEAADADVWLQAGSVHGSLDDLLAQDERFAEFEAFQDRQVWASDKRTTPGGGNAVYETAYTRADLFLADLVEILHPESSDHELVFFGRVGGGPSS
ncbi:MAG: ABC transporter substrate-binding protein [Actinomycetota bacterium]|nr:ABC transporter substrate-binding protein [Actinomycetota bacterium]